MFRKTVNLLKTFISYKFFWHFIIPPIFVVSWVIIGIAVIRFTKIEELLTLLYSSDKFEPVVIPLISVIIGLIIGGGISYFTQRKLEQIKEKRRLADIQYAILEDLQWQNHNLKEVQESYEILYSKIDTDIKGVTIPAVIYFSSKTFESVPTYQYYKIFKEDAPEVIALYKSIDFLVMLSAKSIYDEMEHRIIHYLEIIREDEDYDEKSKKNYTKVGDWAKGQITRNLDSVKQIGEGITKLVSKYTTK